MGKKTGPNPTDRAKKGTKKSVLVDGRGVPVGITVAGANTPDFKLMRATVESIPVPRPTPTEKAWQNLCVDLGYDYGEVRRLAADFGFRLHVPSREPRKKVRRPRHQKARRWVVERTHAWLTRFRRLLVRWEKREDTYLGMLHFALGIITWFHAFLPK